jgi:predicted acylesterase/phospholipase RssA
VPLRPWAAAAARSPWQCAALALVGLAAPASHSAPLVRHSAPQRHWCDAAVVVQVLQETFAAGPQEIEDLWLPFFCVSTNLSRAQVQVHQLGTLWKYVRASMTIVGMLPPVISGGEMLVDGGYLNNVPVDIMHGLGVRTVIVVRLMRPCSAAAFHQVQD